MIVRSEVLHPVFRLARTARSARVPMRTRDEERALRAALQRPGTGRKPRWIRATIGLLSATLAACDSGGPANVRYRTEVVSRGSIVASVSATGTVNPTTLVQVGTYVSGPIESVFADFNSMVTEGQLVAKIDPRPFALRVRQARAELSNARATLEKARAEMHLRELRLRRSRKLFVAKTLSKDELDEANTAFEQARAEVALDEAKVEQAQARLAEAEVNLAYTDIVSPLDGIVISRDVDVGQTVAASFQTPTLFVIAGDLRKMQVNAAVSEADIGLVSEGQEATFTVDAYPERVFTGTVSQVRNAPQNVQNVITYDVIVNVANDDLKLKPGMTASVSIVTAKREDVLKIPIAALYFTPPDLDGSQEVSGFPSGRRVWLLNDEGELRAVEVSLGISDGVFAEVLGNELDVGDEVIVGLAPVGEGAKANRHPPGFGPRYRRDADKQKGG